MVTRKPIIPIVSLMILIMLACQVQSAVVPSTSLPDPKIFIDTATLHPATRTHTPTITSTASPQPSDTPAGPPTTTLTPTLTPLPTKTATSTPLPTKSIVRVEVLERANCRYGPGSVYLYKYGLVPGSNMNMIGRIESGDWVYIQAIGGNNPCWVKASLVKISGDLWSVEVVYPGKALLPPSPYYPPVSWVSATRNDATISVSWNDVPLRAGDEEDDEMQHYIVEVWRCEGGQQIFEALGTNQLYLSFIDQYGCPLPSHGRVYVQEKHGFAGPVEIPWP